MWIRSWWNCRTGAETSRSLITAFLPCWWSQRLMRGSRLPVWCSSSTCRGVNSVGTQKDSVVSFKPELKICSLRLYYLCKQTTRNWTNIIQFKQQGVLLFLRPKSIPRFTPRLKLKVRLKFTQITELDPDLDLNQVFYQVFYPDPDSEPDQVLDPDLTKY